MADKSVTATARNSKGSDGGILGRQLVHGIEDAQSFLKGLSSRLCFIMGGLRAELPDMDGAVGFISDLEDDVRDHAEDLSETLEKARSMVEVAAGSAPILPSTTTEAELFEAIKTARGSWASEFICKAGLEAARIYKERFTFPDGCPGAEDETEAVEAAMLASPEAAGEARATSAKEGRHE